MTKSVERSIVERSIVERSIVERSIVWLPALAGRECLWRFA